MKKPRPSIFSGVSPYGIYEGPRGNSEEWRAAFAYAWNATTAKKIIKEESPWDILGVDRKAPWSTITKAFRRLILVHHPDKGGDPETCKKIIAAYTILHETYNQ